MAICLLYIASGQGDELAFHPSDERVKKPLSSTQRDCHFCDLSVLDMSNATVTPITRAAGRLCTAELGADESADFHVPSVPVTLVSAKFGTRLYWRVLSSRAFCIQPMLQLLDLFFQPFLSPCIVYSNRKYKENNECNCEPNYEVDYYWM